MNRALLAAAICIVAAALTVRAARADDAALDPALNEQMLNVPGDPDDPVLLQVTVLTPQGPGPFPLAVLNHGKTYGQPHDEPRYRSAYIARYFLSRGYAVVLPMLRGFAGSGGTFDPHACDVEEDGLAQARDIAAVIGYFARQPFVDRQRIVVSGQSLGGWNTLALGTLGISGVRALLDFSGGIHQADCPGWGANLVAAARQYGAQTRVPSLWFYGDNDSQFPPGVWRGMYRSYVAAGGPARMVAYGDFLSDAHNMLGSLEGFPIWMPKVDAFLASVGLPGQLLFPRYLPMPPPPPSHFAELDDVGAVPSATPRMRQDYSAFLRKPVPRVFLLATGGIDVSFSGGYDPLARALAACRRYSLRCRVYAVDGEVVWRPHAAAQSTTMR